MGKRQRSPVWDHFHWDGPEWVVCDYCESRLKKGGGTSNMLKHVERKHPDKIRVVHLDPDSIIVQDANQGEVDNNIRITYVMPDSKQFVRQNLKDLSDGNTIEAEAHLEEGGEPVPLIRLNGNTILEDGSIDDGKKILVKHIKKKKKLIKRFSNNEPDEEPESYQSHGYQSCRGLEKQKLVAEIDRLKTEGALVKEKLELEIETQRYERDKMKAEAEFIFLKLEKARKELSIT